MRHAIKKPNDKVNKKKIKKFLQLKKKFLKKINKKKNYIIIKKKIESNSSLLDWS